MSDASLDGRGLPAEYQFQPGWEITPRDARELLRRPEESRPLLLDVRRLDEFETARVAGATLIPLHELPMRLDEIEHHRDRPVITMCHHGRRSLRAASILRNAGFTNVLSLAGGIDLWSMDIDGNIPRY
ncbi:MAG: hypothetical protein KF684_09170 [Phycisphaeraceae bacterium]|nr:hypothetical protein [Phycisphaeraceae bacterium]